jgi:hemerythrin-like domain-containing protein
VEILRREHGWIAGMTDCLEKLIAEGRARGQLDEEAYELLELYETFADGRHQEKEESVLFTELLSVASDAERRLLGRLLQDHEAERRRMASMRLHLMGAVYGEPLCVRTFAQEAAAYLDLHRAHMQREGEQLFPLVERLLTPDADERVAAGFEALEGGSGDPHGIAERIRGLRRRLGMPVPPAA